MIAADRMHRAAPARPLQPIVHRDRDAEEDAEHQRNAAPLVEVGHHRFQQHSDGEAAHEQAAYRGRREIGRMASLTRAHPEQQHHGTRHEREDVRHDRGDDDELSEVHHRRVVGQVDRAGRAEDVELHPENREQAGECRDEAWHA